MTIFEDDGGLIVHLSELTSNESDDAVFEVMCIVEEDRFRGIDILEGFLEMMFGGSLACLVQVLEFIEEAINPIFSCEEPLESRDGCIHPTSSIDTRSDLESYQVSVIFSDFVSSFEELPESPRFRLIHLPESKRHDRTILTDDWHTVRDRSE